MYLLRYVLHDWDDETCIQILRRCREAMAPGARVVVIEMVLGSIGHEPEVVPSQDLNMLAVLEGRRRLRITDLAAETPFTLEDIGS